MVKPHPRLELLRAHRASVRSSPRPEQPKRSAVPSSFATRPRIAVVDYEVTESSPSGSCHLRLLEGLRHEIDFTVFAAAFENPDPTRIRWVRIPAVRRPLAALFVSFYFASSVALRRFRRSFDLVQAVEGYTAVCDISYVHFCHRSYLRRSLVPRGVALRDRVRRLDHRLRAAVEGQAVRAPALLVTPAQGLAHELQREYGVDPKKVCVIPNPVDIARFTAPASYSRSDVRARWGVTDDDFLVAFVALGHFERKGLRQLLEGLRASGDPAIRLLVVGGEPDLLTSYRRVAADLGLNERVAFPGMQTDVRPLLWAADAFALPSSYEVFALAPLQAAAASLPLLVTDVAGVAPFFRDGEHGYLVTRDPENIAEALLRLKGQPTSERREMGRRARDAVHAFGVEPFLNAWRAVYRDAVPRSSRI